MKTRNNSILDIRIGEESITEILSRVDGFLQRKRKKCFHIANLNSDIFAIAYKNENFRKILNNADSLLIDGVGVSIAAKLVGKRAGERMTGTDLMELLIKYASQNEKKVMLLGGRGCVSELAGNKLKNIHTLLDYLPDTGATNIRSETVRERNRILSKIRNYRPDFLFVAYGPPYQENWIHTNRKELEGVVCMGVGGAFNLVSGRSRRCPVIFRKAGIEWFWRLLFEPARIRKFPRHIYFICLISFLCIRKLGKRFASGMKFDLHFLCFF
jgi:N-acetylglucosaminyldiphosphoundecaprenol N-acetyl-beta-D-mannosaminyltransferase